MSEVNLPLHPSMVHPLTREPLRAVYVDSKGRARYPIMGGAPEDPPKEDPPKVDDPPKTDPPKTDPPKTDPPKPSDKDLGFPKDTPTAEMTVEQREAYWKYQSRKHEDTWKGLVGDRKVDDVKNDLAEMERIRQEKLTPSERAIEEAKAEAKAEARREFADDLVRTKFEAVLSHVDEDRRTKIIGGLNLSSYLDNEGRVDADKVKSYAEAIAPVDTTNPPKRRDWGAGNRPPGEQKRGAAGSAEAARRFGKTKTTTDA